MNSIIGLYKGIRTTLDTLFYIALYLLSHTDKQRPSYMVVMIDHSTFQGPQPHCCRIFLQRAHHQRADQEAMEGRWPWYHQARPILH